MNSLKTNKKNLAERSGDLMTKVVFSAKLEAEIMLNRIISMSAVGHILRS